MTVIKSFSVGDGDMFYINHISDSFTIIDCFLDDENRDSIVSEIKEQSRNKTIIRFLSTHPDEDHIHGLDYLDNHMKLLNFYCVNNEATKEDESISFKKYCEFRNSDKTFYLKKGCARKWLNQTDETRSGAGLSIRWPDENNEYFKEALIQVKNGKSPNNISPIIEYSMQDSATLTWMGDLEKDFMNNVKEYIFLSKTDILFAPHHGRESGKIPQELLNMMEPKIIIIGEAPSKNLNYYQNYNTITQNSAGNILFHCVEYKVHIYVSNINYSVDFLPKELNLPNRGYIGTLTLKDDDVLIADTLTSLARKFTKD